MTAEESKEESIESPPSDESPVSNSEGSSTADVIGPTAEEASSIEEEIVETQGSYFLA